MGPTIPDNSRSLDSSLCSLSTEWNGDLKDGPIHFFHVQAQPAQAYVQTDYGDL